MTGDRGAEPGSVRTPNGNLNTGVACSAGVNNYRPGGKGDSARDRAAAGQALPERPAAVRAGAWCGRAVNNLETATRH
jgi:hypothetical protein